MRTQAPGVGAPKYLGWGDRPLCPAPPPPSPRMPATRGLGDGLSCPGLSSCHSPALFPSTLMGIRGVSGHTRGDREGDTRWGRCQNRSSASGTRASRSSRSRCSTQCRSRSPSCRLSRVRTLTVPCARSRRPTTAGGTRWVGGAPCPPLHVPHSPPPCIPPTLHMQPRRHPPTLGHAHPQVHPHVPPRAPVWAATVPPSP